MLRWIMLNMQLVEAGQLPGKELLESHDKSSRQSKQLQIPVVGGCPIDYV